jgi:hypothetical protein
MDEHGSRRAHIVSTGGRRRTSRRGSWYPGRHPPEWHRRNHTVHPSGGIQIDAGSRYRAELPVQRGEHDESSLDFVVKDLDPGTVRENDELPRR